MKSIPFTPDNFPIVSDFIKRGGVTILPTDTIPGFSVDPENTNAVIQLSRLKKRPAIKPYLLLVSDISLAEKVCFFSEPAKILAKRYWPGPLTLLLPRKANAMPDFFSDYKNLAVRVPGHNGIRNFLSVLKKPLVSTSVNISGVPPLVTESDIKNTFESEDILLSFSQKLKRGSTSLPSTIVQIEGEKVTVLRKGIIPIESRY